MMMLSSPHLFQEFHRLRCGVFVTLYQTRGARKITKELDYCGSAGHNIPYLRTYDAICDLRPVQREAR